jgi:hypothetical protein
MAAKDPDETVVAIFKTHAVRDENKTIKAGRPIFDDMEICELRYPGSRSVSVFPATAFSHWHTDPFSGEQARVTYAERFSRQYQQFKSHSAQTKSGTPLDYVSFLTDARRAEMRAMNIYTVEQLAAIDGQELKNIGVNGREYKIKAQEYIDDTRKGAPNMEMARELEGLRARNAILEEDAERLLKLRKSEREKPAAPGDEFEGMSIEQLRDFIATNTGHAPHGTIGKKTLIRMAMDAQPVQAGSGE